MALPKINVLMIEDNDDDADIIRIMLSRIREPLFSLVHVRRLSEGLQLLGSRKFDIVLLDLGLPDSRGLEGVQSLRDRSARIPVIVLSGLEDEATAIRALQMDVQDYLTKGQIDSNLLVRAIRYAIERRRVVEALQNSEARFRRLSESGVIGIAYFDLAGGIHGANDTLLSMIGYSREELERGVVRWDRLLPQEWLPYMMKLGETFKATGRIPAYETEYLGRDGSRRWGLFGAARTERDDEGVAFVVDITERKKLEEEIRKLANHDPLTGLPNRRLFMELLGFKLAEARRNKTKMGILFLDLDRFKEVNDALGHEAGDELLKTAAQRLRSAIREVDAVARIGGDEFSALLAGITCPEDILTIVRKILRAFQERSVVTGHEVNMTTSMGISIYPDDSDDIHELFRYADAALYRAKGRGRNGFEFYDPTYLSSVRAEGRDRTIGVPSVEGRAAGEHERR